MKALVPIALALVFGVLFGAGLIISGMTDPANVKAFLDVAGTWRPALAIVMGTAVLVALPLYRVAQRHGRALFSGPLDNPPRKVDTRLIVGAAIFGIGWGLSGICPGPAIVWLGLSPATILPFLLAFIAGALLVRLLPDDRPGAGPAPIKPQI